MPSISINRPSGLSGSLRISTPSSSAITMERRRAIRYPRRQAAEIDGEVGGCGVQTQPPAPGRQLGPRCTTYHWPRQLIIEENA